MSAITIADLKAERRWIVFALVPQPDGKKAKKVPYTPGTSRKADVSDPATWRTYAEAAADSTRTGRHPGLALTPADELTLVDVDGTESHSLLDALDSYSERSLNGGLHILCGGRPPAGFVAPPGIEVYPRDGNRFLLLTEDIIGGRDHIEDRTELLARLFPARPPATVPPSAPLTMEDAEIVERSRSARNGGEFSALFDRGEIGAYGNDDSRADLALCSMLAFWTQDPEQIDRIFRQSALCREKWERRGKDYREPTITRALNRAAFYTPPATITRSAQRSAVPVAAAPESQSLGFTPGPCADRVAELERQLTERDATIAALQLQVEALSRIPRILANKSHGPSRVVAAVVATQIAWRASAGTTPPKEQDWDVPFGMMAINLSGEGGIADRAGVSVNTASSHLQTLEDRGLLRKETKSVKVASAGDINATSGEIYDDDQYVTQLFIGPAKITPINAQAAIDLTNHLASFSIARVEHRGGKRIPRCPDHPDDGVVREFVDRCAVTTCKRVLNTGDYLLPPMVLGPPEAAPTPPATESQTLGITTTAVVDRSYSPQTLGFTQDANPAPNPQRPSGRTLVAGAPRPPTGTLLPPGICLDCGEKIPIGTYYCGRHGGSPAPPDRYTDVSVGALA